MRRTGWIAVVLLVAGCGGESSRCKRFADQAEKNCVREATQTIYVDGKPVGQLSSDEAAREQCRKARADEYEWCKGAPDDVLACAERPYDDPVRKGARCQELLEGYWAKTHPDDAPAKPTRAAREPAPPPPAAPPDAGAQSLLLQANELIAAEKLDDAVRVLERAIAELDDERGPQHPSVIGANRRLGELHLRRGDPAAAVAPLERAAHGFEEVTGPDHPLTADARFALARALWDSKGDRKRARKLATQAREVFAKSADLLGRLAEVDKWLAAHR